MSDVEVAELGLGPAQPRSATHPRLFAPPAFSRRRAWVGAGMAAADAVSAAVSLFLVLETSRLLDIPVGAVTAGRLVAPAVLLVFLSKLLGVYDHSRTNPADLFKARVQAGLVFATFAVVPIWQDSGLALQLLVWCAALCTVVIVGTTVSALAQALLVRLNLWQPRTVIVGDPIDTQKLALLIETAAGPATKLRIVARAAYDDPRLSHPASLASEAPELAVLMSCGDWQEDVRRAAALDFPSVIVARDAADAQTLWLQTHLVGQVVGIEVRHRVAARSRTMKRAMDLLIGIAILLCTLPLIGVLAAAVWAVDRNNPFYAQTRIGLHGRGFRVWKVRTMFVDAERRLDQHLATNAAARTEWARHFKLARDPRILPGVGHLIRRSSLDELPQLWNVVRGDMSLVGPRPFPAYHLAGFSDAFQALRATVMPGLTGLWQITARSNGDLEVQENADRFYVRHCSIWFDLYILLSTIPAVVLGRGAR